MTTKKKTEVAEVEKSNSEVIVASQTPEFMKQFAGQGTESIEARDVEIPRLQLLQSLSKEVSDGDESPGTFYHSVLEESIGKSLNIIPVYTDIRYILWKPRHEGGGILARADDGKHWNPPYAEFEVKPYKDSNKKVTWKTKPTIQESGLDQWGSYDPENENSQPAATKMYNIVAYLPDFPELSPCVITLQRGAIRQARKFMGKLKLSPAPSYGQVYTMSSYKENTGEGDFFSYSFERQGFVQDENLFNHTKGMYEKFASLGLNIKNVEELQDEQNLDTDDGPIDI